MTVSKRLRYEVLRRDNHACRYCGGIAPDAIITVDHVVPVSLGGQDIPENLVAACRDCNAGKAASGPNEPIVADVAQDALRFRAALLRAEAMARDVQERQDEFTRVFRTCWNQWTYSGGWENGAQIRKCFELPGNWKTRLDKFFDAGITEGDLRRAIEVAMTAKNCKDEFNYTIGILNNIYRERVEVARAFMVAESAE